MGNKDPPPELTEAEAAKKRAEHGPNTLPRSAPPSIARLVLRQLADPLNAILIVAGLASFFLIGEALQSGAIVAIVVVNSLIATVQQRRATRAVELLKDLTAPEATVRREGRARRIPAADLVPGDIVELAAGDRVPADIHLFRSSMMATDESLLTGESLPVSKSTDADDGDRARVFAGTLAVRGHARGVVEATGSHTRLGKIARQLGEETAPPLERELKRAAWKILTAALVAATILVLVVQARGEGGRESFLDAVLAGVALAVAAVPEGLVAIVTTALALGAQRMARRGAIVRHLRAIDALGAASILCVDKTGTLTEGRLAVGESVAVEGDAKRLWNAAVLCNDAQGSVGDPLEVALLEHAKGLGIEAAERRRISERPFDPKARSMTTVHEGPILTLKGAPETVLARCRKGPIVDAIGKQADRLARDGLRVLVFAQAATPDLDAKDLDCIGLVAFTDPIRPQAREAVEACRRAGIRLVLVTGDHPETARAVARELGMDIATVVTGAELAALDEAGRRARLGAATIVARVDPSAKVDLVDVHRATGQIVVMTGDGINDAPALQRADMGVAVAGEGGTDVAREAADLVITNQDLRIIVHAVREGRVIHRNIVSVITYLLMGNVSEITVVLVGLVVFPELLVPLAATQLLWVNLITDGLPALALGIDRPATEPLDKPPRPPHEQVLGWDRLGRVAWRGVLVGAVVLLVGGVWRAAGSDPALLQTQLLISLITVHVVLVYVARADDGPFPRGWWKNRWLLATVAASLALQFVAMAIPFTRAALEIQPLPLAGWLIAVTGAAAALAGIETGRLIGRGFRKRSRPDRNR